MYIDFTRFLSSDLICDDAICNMVFDVRRWRMARDPSDRITIRLVYVDYHLWLISLSLIYDDTYITRILEKTSDQEAYTRCADSYYETAIDVERN